MILGVLDPRAAQVTLDEKERRGVTRKRWNLTVRMTRVQPEDADWGKTEYHLYETELVVELYLQGRSFQEVSDVTGYPEDHVADLVRGVDSVRPPDVAAALARRRSEARGRLATMDLRRLATHWLDGAEVENLAVVHGIPRDLLWDAIADEVSKIGSVEEAQQKARDLMCIAGPCQLACEWTCGFTVQAAGTGRPAGSAPVSKGTTKRQGSIPVGRLSSAVSVRPDSTRPTWRASGPDRD